MEQWKKENLSRKIAPLLLQACRKAFGEADLKRFLLDQIELASIECANEKMRDQEKLDRAINKITPDFCQKFSIIFSEKIFENGLIGQIWESSD